MNENPELQPCVDKDLYFLDPEIHPPPLGVKLILLTPGNVAVMGVWKAGEFDAWHPQLKVPASVKKRREAAKAKPKDGQAPLSL